MSLTSTETLMAEKKVEGTDNAAKIFLLGNDPNAEPGKLNPKDPANTFILNSEDFVNLQRYVRACTALPSTEALFEAEFSRENLKKFFSQDDTPYDYMKKVLPRMHKRANDFQVDTIEPMLVLGGRIANFAKDSGQYLQTIVASLTVMGEPGMVKGNLKYDAAKRRADTMLDRLANHAMEVEGHCVDTENVDLKDIREIDRRLKKILPDDEAKKSRVQKLIDEARLLVQAAEDMLKAEVGKARERGELKWYHYIPVVGAIILMVNLDKHRGLINRLGELNEMYQLAKKKGANAIESITAASHQLDSLLAGIKGVRDTIDNAIKSVGRMQKTFGELKTMFLNIKAKLEYINSDINDEFISDYIVPLGDLKDAAETWKRVYALAKVFQSTGLVGDAKNAPGYEELKKEG
ncbi:hypothetical protein BHE90_008701 [Fusarium euwallaceae]|uniref:Uncharacterized protein n=2 Tax=Fusarium solani species complex TaxID=232080 RepID=A0A428T806_9HYPO|nr:hypothetical protein CEP52_010469 [Fusarium oligoseptatum]RTE76811.1 hypothetical protein BHE90_008701 [Fusarium euwallaceae]